MSMGAAASMPKIHAWLLREKGIKSSWMGARWAMWRYAAKHPEEAFPLYKKWHFEYASSINGEENVINFNAEFNDFLKDIQYRAIHSGDSILSRQAYRRFCNKYNLAE